MWEVLWAAFDCANRPSRICEIRSCESAANSGCCFVIRLRCRGPMCKLAFVMLILCCCFNANAQAPPSKPPQCLNIPSIPKGPLGEVDQNFLDSYCALQLADFAHEMPYVVVLGSKLTLRWGTDSNKSPDEEKGIPDTYHALKDVAHVPFSVYLLVRPLDRGFFAFDRQKLELTKLKDRIHAAKSAINIDYFSNEQIDRQKRILDESETLLTSILGTGKTSHAELSAFAAEMGPLMLQNAWDAGCEQIKTTHAQMMAWKKQLTADEWANLVVVNVARHQARYRNADTQYFHWLFGDSGPAWGYPGESMRVIFAETLGKDGTYSDELTIVQIDADASQAFFSNPWRMSEDILSDGAAACIAKLPERDRLYTNSTH
jgi:hypothetical protein